MLIHIVKTGETVDKIVDSYRILKSDLISNNLHVTDFSHLKSGMKLKIPLIPKDTVEVLEETEAFIDDYYPSFEKFLNNNEKINDEKVINVKEEIVNEDYEEEVHEGNEQKEVNVKEEKNDNYKKVDNYNKSSNNNIYRGNKTMYYNGNVIPKINEKYIKKI